jgi:hypothetical protein
MSFGIKGTIKIKSWKPDGPQLLKQLAKDPRTKPLLNGLAQQIVDETLRRFPKGSSPPPNMQYERINGIYWSAAPDAVSKMFEVKDGTRTFGSKRGEIRVALVINNHPYSLSYEIGNGVIPASRAMGSAVRAVAARNPGTKVGRGSKV